MILFLLTISAGMLVVGGVVSGYIRDLLVNVGASVVIVALSYAIFDPVFQEIRRSPVQEQPTFDDEKFSRTLRTPNAKLPSWTPAIICLRAAIVGTYFLRLSSGRFEGT
jgi:hypothetical protein